MLAPVFTHAHEQTHVHTTLMCFIITKHTYAYTVREAEQRECPGNPETRFDSWIKQMSVGQ